MLLWGVAGGGWGGGAGNRIDRCRAPQEKLHGIRVVVTGCLAQRRTPVGLSLVDRGVVFQNPGQLHGRHSPVPWIASVGGGGAGNRIDHCRAPQEKLHGIRVVVTGCLAQRRFRRS